MANDEGILSDLMIECSDTVILGIFAHFRHFRHFL